MVAALEREVTTEKVDTSPDLRPSGRGVLWIARTLLVGQLAWLIAFSTVKYRRGSLTFDFAAWNQASWLITHGHLNPHSTVLGMPFWQINGTWLMWPLAELTRLPPHALILLWFQDLTVFGCGWVVLDWVAEAAAGTSLRHRQWRLPYEWKSPLSPAAAVALAAVLLLADPWVYTTAAYDFHWEAPAAFFALLAAWDLARGRTRRLWLWVALTLATADVSALYVAGIGLAGLVARNPRTRRTAALVAASGFAWIGLMSLIHANRGSILTVAYAYLAGSGAQHPTLGQIAFGAIAHPGRPFSQLWYNRVNLWANLSPSGLLGVATPLGLGAVFSVLIPAALWNHHDMAAAAFQNFPAFPFVTIGSVLVLGRLGAHRAWVRHAARPLALAMAGFTVAWAWVWLPLYPAQWLGVMPSDGQALVAARAVVPSGAVVVASDIICGRFAGRAGLYDTMGFPFTVPVTDQPVYFVLDTHQGGGIPNFNAEAMIGQLANSGAQLLMHRSGIWVFRSEPPKGTPAPVFAGSPSGLPAWLLQSSVGAPITVGPGPTWRMEGDGRPGIVLWGDYWYETSGSYSAWVDLAAPGPRTVRVVDTQTGTTLATLSAAGTGQRRQVEVPFTVGPVPPPLSGLGGRGPFKVQSYVGSVGRLIEVQVINPSKGSTSLYTVGVKSAG